MVCERGGPGLSGMAYLEFIKWPGKVKGVRLEEVAYEWKTQEQAGGKQESWERTLQPRHIEDVCWICGTKAGLARLKYIVYEGAGKARGHGDHGSWPWRMFCKARSQSTMVWCSDGVQKATRRLWGELGRVRCDVTNSLEPGKNADRETS